MKIVITGAAGWLGRHVATILDHEVNSSARDWAWRGLRSSGGND